MWRHDSSTTAVHFPSLMTRIYAHSDPNGDSAWALDGYILMDCGWWVYISLSPWRLCEVDCRAVCLRAHIVDMGTWPSTVCIRGPAMVGSREASGSPEELLSWEDEG